MLEVLVKVFAEIVNNFYKEGVTVSLSDTPDTAYCEKNHITLPRHLLEQFTANKLPRFTVLYHELGHALYSHDLSHLLEKWSNLPPMSTFTYDNKYHHLINWIEDFYIEDKLVQDYPYLKDIIGCLKLLTLPYDITDIDKAFNHYYVKGYTTPKLPTMDAIKFKNYITKILQLRSSNGFGRGPVSLLSQKSRETQYIKLIVEFYDWCVTKGIFDAQQTLPPLTNPNMTTSNGATSNSVIPNDVKPVGNSDDVGPGGSYTDHSHLVGVTEILPKYDQKELEIFSDKFIAEQKLIKEEIMKQFKVNTSEQSLDGLFNSKYKDSSIIQPKVIVPNFFNPNRLVDQVLFKTPDKCFSNVSIYRDVSGSTYDDERFPLINSICRFLNEKIPIDYNFYLYASGNISIVQTSFEDWEDCNEEPDVYQNDPLIQQLGGGTNSSAIADIITEQLNDKWLNIIITDGDLHDLMRRENIQSLLENVFVISVCDSSYLQDIPNYVVVDDVSLIPTIPNAIMNMKGV